MHPYDEIKAKRFKSKKLKAFIAEYELQRKALGDEATRANAADARLRPLMEEINNEPERAQRIAQEFLDEVTSA